ncbi:MAG: molybdenum cofactor guanylyltransferase [Phycisphaerales bacterium]|nr:molybdenum cofactor guanylyltransferase [Phycisphaerae bacterium]NNF41798.1 molybdenum cofactor guanylyltransferase [Phycisphaerales bacterium]NNM24996.1 molybdenum cofactor guanylyltransferase [Phycisphaerales bacterium]
MSTIVGVILAGGRSRRMGREKATLAWPGGGTMIDRVATTLQSVCDEVIVSGVTTGVPELPRIPDEHDDAGPLAGLAAVLACGRADAYLVCPCDTPNVTSATLRRLLTVTPAAATIFRVADEPRPRPLPLRIDTAALPVIRRRLEAGERTVLDALEEAGVEVVTLADGAELANVNTPEDYERLVKPQSRDRPS